MTVKLKLNFC